MKNKSECKIGDCVELLPPFDIYKGDDRLCVFIKDVNHLEYIKKKNYRIIEVS